MSAHPYSYWASCGYAPFPLPRWSWNLGSGCAAVQQGGWAVTAGLQCIFYLLILATQENLKGHFRHTQVHPLMYLPGR